MSKFFSRLSYSFGNEDCHTEHQALQIKPDDRVVCITASGDRPMNLLIKECKHLVAVDANPVQNYLLDLKSCALKMLNSEEYLAFLGVTHCKSRKSTLRKLLPHLNIDSARYWKRHEHLVHKGIIYQGATEKWIRTASYLPRIFRNKEVQALFSYKDLEEQREFLKKNWNHSLWQNCIKLAVHPWVSKLFLKDPGMYAYLGSSPRPDLYLYQRWMDALNKGLARENPLISLMLLGKVLPEGMPPYLTGDSIEEIRKRIDRVTIKTQDVITYLESVPENSFDVFSLSDVASYIDYPSFLRLLKAIVRTGSPNARFCLRQFMTRYKVPEGLERYFVKDNALKAHLEAEDHAFVYDFTVGKILK